MTNTINQEQCKLASSLRKHAFNGASTSTLTNEKL